MPAIECLTAHNVHRLIDDLDDGIGNDALAGQNQVTTRISRREVEIVVDAQHVVQRHFGNRRFIVECANGRNLVWLGAGNCLT